MENLPTLVGRKFGKLTVVSFSHTTNQKRYWSCECECGNVIQRYTNTLTNGRTKSCGCLISEVLRKRNTTHGQSVRDNHSPEYNIWQGMLARCYNINNKRFENYGGRGIEICKRWYKFNHFFSDMGKRPTPLHSLDRIDNDGNYEPENCRWATNKQQSGNRRSNVFIEFEGKTMTQIDWARFFKVCPSSLCVYIKKHGVEKAMLHYAKK